MYADPRPCRRPRPCAPVLLAAVGLAACGVGMPPPPTEPAPAIPPPEAASPTPGATLPEGADRVMDAYPDAYPGAVPTAGLDRDAIDGLPGGAAPLAGGAEWLLDGRDPARVWHAVPIRMADGSIDLAVVESDAGGSRAVRTGDGGAAWSLVREARLAPEALSFAPAEVSWTEVDRAHLVAVRSAGAEWVVALDGSAVPDGGSIGVRAALAIGDVDFLPGRRKAHLSLPDWTGDGLADALLAAHDYGAAMLFTPADPTADAVAMQPVARVTREDQVTDVDGDGAAEILRWSDGAWRVERWDGVGFVMAAPVPGDLPQPVPVADGGLPPLPLALYFLRGETVWRWPRAGGALEAVLTDPAAGRNDGWQGGKPRFNQFKVARESGRIAYPLGRFERAPEGYDVEVTELFVLDPATGATTKVALDIADQAPEASALDFFDISPDGAFVVVVGPTLSADRCLSAISVVPVDDPDPVGGGGAVQLGECGRRAEGSTSKCGCHGLLMSPDGRQAAFSDGAGLWAADLPGGPSRRLAEAKYETQMGVGGVHRPRLWSPDGRHLVSRVGYFEGNGNVLWDVETGTAHGLDLFEYVGPGFELAWLSTAGATPELVRAEGGDRLVTRFDPFGAAPARPLVHGLWPPLGEAVVAVGPHALPDGGVGFAVRQGATTYHPGNGVFRVGADGRGLRPLVGLPAGGLEDDGGFAYWLAGDAVWSPDGAAFLFVDAAAGPDARRLVLGLSDGSGAWDVTDVVGDAGGFQWGR